MRLFFIAVLSAISLAMQARDTLFVQQPQYPILIERHDNILMLMRIDAKETGTLNAHWIWAAHHANKLNL